MKDEDSHNIKEGGVVMGSGEERIGMRVESDSMGEIDVPRRVYWGAQTMRALTHFTIRRDQMPGEVIRALAVTKKAAALVNMELGILPEQQGRLIIEAADDIIHGKLNDQFPLSIWQSGSGTQTNMNMNEVIANRAIELSGGIIGSKDPVHPNDHVNMSQSTNDVFPTAMHIAASTGFVRDLIPAVQHLRDALAEKAELFASVIKIGRTHLQDAVPLTVGQEMSGWVSLLERDLHRLRYVLEDLYDLPIGGTAVGTGLNAHARFGPMAAERIAHLTGLPFRPHPNTFAALSAHDELVSAHGAMATLAGSLMKIANDIRWLGSGPRCGLGELVLPANEPGSSMMPGKVNPTQCEVMTMVAVQVHGNNSAVAFAGSQGNFELNVFKPLIISHVVQSLTLLKESCGSFADFLVKDLDIDRTRIDYYVKNSLMLVTAFASVIGYDKAAAVARKAYEQNMNLREACVSLGFLTAEECDAILKPEAMVHPWKYPDD